MEDFLENTIGIALLSGGFFILAAAIVYAFPPKKINYLYGYRTKASMKSQQRWDFSQKYAAIQMFRGGLFMVAVSFAGKMFAIPDDTQVIAGIVVMLVAVAYILLGTEWAIKKRFKEQ